MRYSQVKQPVATIAGVNNELEKIANSIDDMVSRKAGDGPNTLDATLDANSQRIINLPEPVTNTEPVRKADFDDLGNNLRSDVYTAVRDAEDATDDAIAATNAANAAASNAYQAIADLESDGYAVINQLESGGNTAISKIELDGHAVINQIESDGQLALDALRVVNAGSFENGATLTARNEVLYYLAEQTYYRWDGALPKTVAAGSTPSSTGGVGVGAWVDVGDAALRSELASGAAISLNRTIKQLIEQAYSEGAVTVAASNSSSDVKEYATYVCDGVDDHIEINAALSNHSRVILTDGTYFLGGTVQPRSNTALIGQGKDRTKLELVTGLSSSGRPVMRNSNIDNVILKGFTIDGNGDQQGFTGNPEGLRLSTGKNFYIEDVRVFNINHHALEISFGFENAIFEDCEFDYCSGDTMEIEIAENVYFYRCKFSRAGAFAHPTYSNENASLLEFEQKNKNIRFIDCDFDESASRAMLFEVEGSSEPSMEDIYFTRCNFNDVKTTCEFSCPTENVYFTQCNFTNIETLCEFKNSTENVYFTDCDIVGDNTADSTLFLHPGDAHNIVLDNCQISDFRHTTRTVNGDLHVKLYDTDLINVGRVRAAHVGDVKWKMRGGSISYNPDGFFQNGFFQLTPIPESDLDNTVTEITLNDVEVSDLTHPLISTGVKYKLIASNLRLKNVLMTGSTINDAVLPFNLSNAGYASDMDIYVDIKGFTIEGDAELGVAFGGTLKKNLSSGSVQIRLDNWDFQNTLTPFRVDDIPEMGSNLTLGRGLGFDWSPENVIANAGVATITSGTTEVALNHVDTFPVEVQDADIQVTPNGPLGNATQFWAKRFGATTWRIYVDQDPGQDVQFSWRLMRITPYVP